MISVKDAQAAYESAQAAYNAAEDERRAVDAAWDAVREEWGEKRTTALNQAVTANGHVWAAQRELHLATANEAAQGVEGFELDVLKKELRAVFRTRCADKRERYVDAVLTHLVRSQTTHQGTSEESLKAVSIRREPFGGLKRENMQWLTDNQRHKVWQILKRYCPARADNGTLAPPWVIYPD